MHFNILNFKKIIKYTLASIVLTGLFQDATSLAANVTPVYLDKEIGYYDSDVRQL